jgi:ERCC4-type nuclease
MSDPFTILIDHREQRAGYTELLTCATEVGHLLTGDYSVKEMPGLAVVERKAKADLYGVVGQGRERFEKELKRITDEFIYSAIVVEATYASLLMSPGFTNIRPDQVVTAIISWNQVYNVPFFFVGNREQGAEFTQKFLAHAWKYRHALVERLLLNHEDDDDDA